MAKKISTIRNWNYVVTSPEPCTVEDASGLLYGVSAPGAPLQFEALGKNVLLSSDAAIVRESHCSTRTVYGLQPCSTLSMDLKPGVVYLAGLIEQEQDWSALSFKCSIGMVQTCELWFSTGDKVPSITWPVDAVWLNTGDNGSPDFDENTCYRLVLRSEFGSQLIISVSYAYTV